MNIDKLREELESDEGCKHEIYLDHFKFPTLGIGHLITDWDEEYDMEVGTTVSEERVKECFEKDVKQVIKDCKKLYEDFDHLPEDAQLIIANMMFNMGYTRLSKFRAMKSGVDARDWNKAADEMVDSRWYEQVPNRAKRLVVRMRSLHGSI